MKTGKILGLFVLLSICFKGISQTEGLKYLESMSAERKGTKSKQLEGMEGAVEKVVVSTQTTNSLDLDIYFTGYSGKHLKVVALGSSGNPKVEILPFAKKISSGKKHIKARLRLMSAKETSSQFIELVFTNGMFRFKGISYVYELKKDWLPKIGTAKDTATNTVQRTPQTIELRIVPLEEARKVFTQ